MRLICARILLVAVLILFGACLRASAQTQHEIDFTDLASRAANAREQAKIFKVAVCDFVSHNSQVTLLTRNWASAFSAALLKSAPKLNLIDPSRFTPEIEANRLPPAIVSDPEIASWLAKQLGADAFIQGIVSIEPEANKIRLVLQATHIKDETGIGAWRVTLPLTKDLKIQMAKLIEPNPDIPMAKGLGNGYTMPACISCPNPSYTDAALNKHTHGTALLECFVGKDGKARDIVVTQHLPNGLTLRAVQPIQKWTFKPAQTSDGNPIELRLVIKVSFHLYK